MATLFWAVLLLLLLLFSDSLITIQSIGLGINYGKIADNLPSPSLVAYLLASLNITRVKLYDADPEVLSSFAGMDTEFIIGLGNEHLQKMTDPDEAHEWIKENVRPYASRTKIRCITVGNEVLTGNNTQLMSSLLPAMQNVGSALVKLGLSKQIHVATAHSFQILSTSFPPSSGSFRQDLVKYIQGILNFHAKTGSPFLINAYPFFAYKDDPDHVPLSYVLFEPNEGQTDPSTKLHYDNMLYAQIDAVYSAIKALGHADIRVQVSETGWPTKGDSDEVGATVENARRYNGNLLRRVEENQGTPLKPSVPVDIYVFALFNEDMKPGPVSEKNYGLYYPNGSAVYSIGLQGYIPRMDYSASTRNVRGCLLLCPVFYFWVNYKRTPATF
ncbi:hypothetical protein OROMI_015367 [Orobanche minor]